MAVKTFSHIGICIADLDESTRFYTEVLGFHQLFSFDYTDEWQNTMEREGDFTARMLIRGDLRIELVHWADNSAHGDGERRPMNQRGLTHLAFRVDTIDELYDIAQQAGGAAWRDTLSTVHGGGESGVDLQCVYLTDPDGVRVECIAGSPDLATRFTA